MDTIHFLESVLGDEGYYCLFAAQKGNGAPIQRFYDSIDDVVNAAHEFDSKGFDTYYALSTFNNSDKRTKDNIRQVRSMFLDIDCGENKDYSTQKNAIKALQLFCKTVRLPRPIMVNSGRGIHVYWRLESPVTYEQWLPVAERLKAVCTHQGFNVDHVVTSDGARILRVPETHNYKDDPPKTTALMGGITPSISLEDFNALLVENGGDVATPFAFDRVLQVPSNALVDRLAGSYTASFPKIMKKTLKGEGCRQLEIIATDQAGIDEPLWRAGLSIIKPCENSHRYAAFISDKHPNYSHNETIRKMEATEGPYLCQTIDSINPNICPDCPNWTKIKSPIVLGKKVVEAAPEDNVVEVKPTNSLTGDLLFDPAQTAMTTIPPLPKPFMRGKGGGVFVRWVDEEGNTEEKLVYKHDFYAVQRIFNPEDGESYVFRLHLPHDGMREFTVPLAALTNPQRSKEHFAFNGVAFSQQNQNILHEYIMSWVNQLQDSQAVREARIQFGWTEDNRSFVVGADEFTETDVLENPASSATLQYFPSFTPKGTLEGWKDAMEFYNQAGMETHQFVICSAFGSVLMEFIDNVPAAGMHLYSTGTGHGKTTALFAANSIWGNYKSLCVQAEDTMAFAMHRGQVFKNLPLYVDEITNKPPEQLSDFVLQITHGNERGRMQGSQNKERERGQPWSMLSVTTGNVSLIQQVGLHKRSVRAEAARFLEINVDKIDFESKQLTDDFNTKLANNYGHAGPIFIKNVLADKDKVQQLLQAVQRKMDVALGLNHQHRFWSAFIACTITGALLAKKWGLINFNTDRLTTHCTRLINYNKGTADSTAESTTLEELVSEYLLEVWGKTLHIVSVEDRRGKGEEQTAVPTKDPNQSIVARYETDTKLASIMVKPFQTWCAKRQVNYEETRQQMIDELGASSKTVRLTKGTKINMPPSRCLVFRCDFTDLDGSDT